MKTLLLTLLFSSFALFSSAQEILGTWKTIDDKTGRPRAVVDLYEKGGKLYGKLIKTFPKEGEDPDPLCKKCEGEDKDAKIIGMDIIRGMVKDGDEWDDGTILDAEEGRTYDCKLWIEDGKLQVRGYVAFFYRTQTWLRYTED